MIPSAKAAHLTMNREGIRRLAAETLQVPTAQYSFADNLEELKEKTAEIGFPCVIKPIMSSSGKGQSICRSEADVEDCWNYAMEGGRAKNNRVIIEEFIHFDSEITLLTVRSVSGTMYCPPIGHIQQDGDYIESWQPHAMTEKQIKEAQSIAGAITEALGGFGLFGVELFIAPDKIYFSEVSPRPHDTGMVTLATQDLSEFSLHVRAILGFPIPDIQLIKPGASHTLKATEKSADYVIDGVGQALSVPCTQVRIFGKPETKIGRRMAVTLSTADDIDTARSRAKQAAESLTLKYSQPVS